MKIRKLTIAVLGCILVCSLFGACTPKKKEFGTVDIDVTVRDGASSVFSEYTYVPLETTAQSIMGNVDGLEVSDDLICARCKDEIFVFDRNGKFINKISHKGNGAGEYIRIEDFKIKDGNIWVLSYANQAILTYDKEGKFIDKIELGTGYRSFDIYGDDTICLASEFNNDSNNNFVFFDLNEKKETNAFDKFENRQGIIFEYPAFIGRYDNFLFVTHPFDYTVYNLTDGGFEPEMMLTFNTNDQFPDNAKDLSLYELYEKTLFKNVVCAITMMHDTKDYRYIAYPLFGQYGIIYNLAQLRDGKMEHHVALCETMDKDFPYADRPLTRCGDWLVSYMNASAICYIEDHNGLDKFKKLGLTEDDNPVVFFHKLR